MFYLYKNSCNCSSKGNKSFTLHCKDFKDRKNKICVCGKELISLLRNMFQLKSEDAMFITLFKKKT